MQDVEAFALPGSVASQDAATLDTLNAAPPASQVCNNPQLESMLRRHVQEVEAMFQQHQQDLLCIFGQAGTQKPLQQQQKQQCQQTRRWSLSPETVTAASAALPLQSDRPENPLAKLLMHKKTRAVAKPRASRSKSLADLLHWSGNPSRISSATSVSSGASSAADVTQLCAQRFSQSTTEADQQHCGRDMQSIARLQQLNNRNRIDNLNEPQGHPVGWHSVLVQKSDEQHSRWPVARNVMKVLGLREKEKKRKFAAKGHAAHKVTNVIHSRAYELAYIFITLFDICVLLWEAQVMSRLVLSQTLNSQGALQDSRICTVIADCVCFTFVIDLTLRLCAHGFEVLKYSLLDACSVLVYVFQVAVNHAWMDQRASLAIRVVSSHLSIFRVARLVRILHVSALVRKQPAFRTLRLISYSLSSSNAVGTLLCICSTIFGICVFFGVFLTEGSMAFLLQHGPTTEPELHQYFGTVFRSVFSLYQAMTGGEDWANIYHSLNPLGGVYQTAFIVFQGFTWIALLNVVTASFVENTLQRSKEDREFMVQTEIEVKKSYLDAMKEIFHGLDDDDSGSIEIGELQECLQKKDIGAWFASLGIDVEQVGNLFKLLDRDKSGTLDEEEFIFGCLQLRGEARNIDVALLQYQVAELSDHLAALGDVLAASVVDESVQIPPRGRPPPLPKQ